MAPRRDCHQYVRMTVKSSEGVAAGHYIVGIGSELGAAESREIIVTVPLTAITTDGQPLIAARFTKHADLAAMPYIPPKSKSSVSAKSKKPLN